MKVQVQVEGLGLGFRAKRLHLGKTRSRGVWKISRDDIWYMKYDR